MSNNFRVYFNRFRRNCCLKKRTVEANNIDHENLFHLIGWMHIASQTFYWRKSILRQSALRYKHSHRKFSLMKNTLNLRLHIKINWFLILIDLPIVHVTLFYISYCYLQWMLTYYIHVLASLCFLQCARLFKFFRLQGRQTSG